MPYDPKDAAPIRIVRRVDGQYLSGEMIPIRENSQAGLKEARREEKVLAPLDEDGNENKFLTTGELTPLLEGPESDLESV